MSLTSTFGVMTLKQQFTANSHLPTNQYAPNVLALSNGGYVVAYNNYKIDDGGILLDFYGADGERIGTYREPFQDSTTAVGQPTLTQLASGHVMVVWDEDVVGDTGFRGRLFTPEGATVINELAPLKSSVAPTDPEIAATPDGGFAMVYTFGGNVMVSRHDAWGVVEDLGPVNVNSGLIGDQKEASVAAFADGRFVVTYTDAYPADQTIRAQIYAANGSTWISDFIIATGGDNTQSKVAVLPNGDWAVAYVDTGWAEGGASGAGITLQVFNGSGGAVSAPIHVNATSAGDESQPDITVLDSGHILVAWTYAYSASDHDIRGRIFTFGGEAVTGEFAISKDGSDESAPTIAALKNGAFVTIWQDTASDGEQGQITGEVNALARITKGDNADDIFIGDSMRDDISGGGGDDGLWGGGNDDAIDGGTGEDGLVGGAGDDVLTGGADRDFLFGGSFAPDGSFMGGSGKDTLHGGAGDDGLWAFDGADIVNGDAGNDYVEGGGGADMLNGGADSDFLLGQADADTINGGAGFDYLYGGTGGDMFVFRKGDSADWILDFNAAQGDKVKLEGFGSANFAAAPLVDLSTPGNPAVQLTFYNDATASYDQLTIFGATLAQLNAANVLMG